ncbi:MAG: GTP pyrophosphokinase [Candidatus Peregrinibacteria bacterium Greene0416_19]|nr:MAG: GTP pyrophosphokinase [Candidatus Peregrinibacteria bacterium Greene0416_19]
MLWTEFSASIRHLSPHDRKRLHEAFLLGERLHAVQKRRSGEPYFTHPVTVALRLASVGADADTLIAALLHDTVEDTPITLDEIEAQFDGDVKSLIDGVTKLSASDVAERPTLDEKIETLRKIFRLMQQDLRIMVIKLFDRLHNMETIEFLPEERQRGLAQETLDVYAKIAGRLSMSNLQYELEALCLAVIDGALYEKLVALRKQYIVTCHRVQIMIMDRLEGLHPDLTRKLTMHFEIKSWDNLRVQLETGSAAVTGVASATIVFVCEDRDACYRILGALHEPWKREVMSFQDFINSPTTNGYQGLHTTVILEDGTRVRCKIRTKEMQEYALKGVTLYCFNQQKRAQLRDILPWTQRISPLSEDTMERSEDFWESLQNDILGESITIHGPDDQTVQLPRESTALDGAFFLIGENSLRLRGLKVNGREVPFDTVLKHADTLDPEFTADETVKREWLRLVMTRFATAAIRKGLSSHPEEDREAIGKELLQKSLEEHKRGFLEEIDEKILTGAMRALGYHSTTEGFTALADAKLEANDVYLQIFKKQRKRKNQLEKSSHAVIRYEVEMENVSRMDRLNLIHRQYGTFMQEIRYRKGCASHMTTVTLRLILNPSQLSMLLDELEIAGARHVRLISRFTEVSNILSLALLIVLWGLDPVFSKVILNAGVTASQFTLIRVWSVTGMAMALLLLQQKPRQSSPIPLRRLSLWLAGSSFFLVSLLSYVALSSTSPAIYNIVIRGNTLVVASPLLLQQRSFSQFGLAWLFTVAGLLALSSIPDSGTGMLLSAAVLLTFSIYTMASSYFQTHERVQARFLQFFFWTSAMAAIASLPMLLLPSTFHPVSWSLLAATVLFSLAFVGAPYLLFYYLNHYSGYLNIARYINFSLAITLIAHWQLFGKEYASVLAVAGLCMIMGNLLSAAPGGKKILST